MGEGHKGHVGEIIRKHNSLDDVLNEPKYALEMSSISEISRPYTWRVLSLGV